jgi:predicted nucleotidyltransferase
MMTIIQVTSTCQENMKACRELLEPTELRGPASVAGGDSTAPSDIEVLVDLNSDRENPLLRVAGIAEELRQLPVWVDVVTKPGSGYLRRRP